MNLKKKINFDYMKGYVDFIQFIKISFGKTKKNNSSRVLIVNNGLSGDFFVSIPAIRKYIIENKVKVDLVVSPPVVEIAKKIKGVYNVYPIKTAHNRNTELNDSNTSNILIKNYNYNKIFTIRLSLESYNFIKKLNFNKIINPLKIYLGYTLNLFEKGSKTKTVQLRELYAEILNVKLEILKFEDIFEIDKKYFEKINKFDFFNSTNKNIIIHLTGSWKSNVWDNEKWIKVFKKINDLKNYNLIFIGTNKEEEDYNYIKSKLNFNTFSLIKKISLFELMLLMRKCDFFLGIDSGPRNLAHLTQLKSLTLFGAGPHNIYPFNKEDIYIDKSNGRGILQRIFAFKTGGFISKISVDDVFSNLKKLVKK